jgi:DNA-binding transcriptional regulator YhcF (GntR family)
LGVDLSQTRTDIRNDPTASHDFLPVMRVSYEFFMRSYDLLGQLHENAIGASIIMTLWHGQLAGPGRKPATVRHLSRELNLPYETVRRHVRDLEQGGACVVKNGSLLAAHAMPGNARAARMLRKIYVNAVRLLADLTRIGAVTFPSASRRAPPSGRLAKEQMVVAVAAMGLLLAGVRLMRDFWGGDLLKGLVFTAIWTANVKHVTNTSRAAISSLLPDDLRQPVSVLAIARSLRLPYETARRHADVLVREGLAVRAGRQGVFVPTHVAKGTMAGSVAAHRLVMAFLVELQRGGVKI